jgi:predicted ester cyclase
VGHQPRVPHYAEDAIIGENLMTGAVTGELLGFPGNGRRISFRTLHVFEFRDDRICRENIWLDGAAAAAQLTAP